MKAIEQMFNTEKGKLLAGLFPQEIPNITLFIEQETLRFLSNEELFKSQWKQGLITSNLWFDLVRNVEKAVKRYGNKFRKNHNLFRDQLFDSYDALFTINSLIEYSLTKDCNHRLKLAIHLLFGEDPFIASVSKKTAQNSNTQKADKEQQ
ncbi:hypothetical protein [Chryseobacterium sp. MEBOG07]|uniref:hypothetical protein n=1 Tax=Chryseobacterium sp. MEBOG07 TaxID=2879939 RepID=UPI001F34417B|nr:hypothetical protein [Chryseobacterium sp. MEBOG07]UKB78561.1 hypothetical protein LF886_19135 [Chryseobacterium sp. MEBOG07]